MSNKITGFSFDASTVQPQAPIEIITPGWYHAEITDAEIKATKGRNAGKAAAFELTILDTQYKGRKLFPNINVQNASAQAQEIGQRELSAICHATGIIQVSDLAAFVGKQLQVKVKTKKASEEDKAKGYEDKSEACGYKALEGATLAPSAPVGFVGGPPPIAPPVAPPAAPTPPAPAVAFPPQGWTAHPGAPGCYYCGQEVLTEADLRARFAPVAAPVAPPAPPAPVAPPAPPAAPAVPQAPVGWLPHPQNPAWLYNPANPSEMMEAPAAAVPAPPVADSSVPPWKR